jgi:hypothetical protein
VTAEEEEKEEEGENDTERRRGSSWVLPLTIWFKRRACGKPLILVRRISGLHCKTSQKKKERKSDDVNIYVGIFKGDGRHHVESMCWY